MGFSELRGKPIPATFDTISGLPVFADPQVRRVLLSALCDLAMCDIGNREGWLRHAVKRAQLDPDTLVKIEAVKLVSLITEDGEELYAALLDGADSLSEFIAELLALAEDVQVEFGDVEQVILDAFSKMHYDDSDDDDLLSESYISRTLAKLMDSDSPILRRRAADCFGHVSPGPFLKMLSDKFKSRSLLPGSSRAKDFEGGFINADRVLGTYFYGDMCPGQMNYLQDEPEARQEIYLKLSSATEDAIYLYEGTEHAQSMKDLLDELRVDDLETEPEETWAKPSLDHLTLPLPFDAPDEKE